MAYHQTGLDGSGTALSPFLIRSYSDWEIIDASRDIGDPAPHYKLVSDLNMTIVKRKWTGKDFLGGYLHMDGHKIISPMIEVESYLMHKCNIIGGPLEQLSPVGKTVVKGGESQILHVNGNQVVPILEDCVLQRVFVDTEVDGMWINNDTDTLFGDITARQCYFTFHNDGFKKPLVSSEETIVDCCFEFTGQAYDCAFITGQNEIVLDHCMLRGDIDCSEMIYGYLSTTKYMVDGTISSCVFDINAKGATSEQGWAGYATAVSTFCGPSIATDRKGLFVKNRSEHDHGEPPVTVISPTNFRKPDYLISLGFDVKKLR